MAYVKFSYFGYSAAFTTSASTVAARRQEANEIIISKFGESPAVPYASPGVPFPDFVLMQYWDEETKEWYTT